MLNIICTCNKKKDDADRTQSIRLLLFLKIYSRFRAFVCIGIPFIRGNVARYFQGICFLKVSSVISALERKIHKYDLGKANTNINLLCYNFTVNF